MTIHTIEIDLKKLTGKTGLTQIAPVPRKHKERDELGYSRCGCCDKQFKLTDIRSGYCSDECQLLIQNWHKRVVHNFRPYAELGFTLTWQDPKIFLIRLPKHEDYPVPDSFAFSSYYERGSVRRWNAAVVLHNTLFMGRDDATAALEMTCHDLMDSKYASYGHSAIMSFWVAFQDNLGIPTDAQWQGDLRTCPDCKRTYVICDLWWETACKRDVQICRDCAINDLPF